MLPGQLTPGLKVSAKVTPRPMRRIQHRQVAPPSSNHELVMVALAEALPHGVQGSVPPRPILFTSEALSSPKVQLLRALLMLECPQHM